MQTRCMSNIEMFSDAYLEGYNMDMERQCTLYTAITDNVRYSKDPVREWKKILKQYKKLRETGLHSVTITYKGNSMKRKKLAFLEDMKKIAINHFFPDIKKQKIEERGRKFRFMRDGEELDQEKWEEVRPGEELNLNHSFVEITWRGDSCSLPAKHRFQLMQYDYMRNAIGHHWKVPIELRSRIFFKHNGSVIGRSQFENLVQHGSTLHAYPSRNKNEIGMIETLKYCGPHEGIIEDTSMYDDLDTSDRLLVTLLEPIDNAIPACISSNQRGHIRLRFHKEMVRDKFICWISIVNTGRGMNEEQLQNLWRLGKSKKVKGERDECYANTLSVSHVTGALNWHGQGGKKVMFLCAEGGIVTSRVKNSDEVTTMSCSKVLTDEKVRRGHSGEYEGNFHYPQARRGVGSRRKNFEFTDKMHAEFWKTKTCENLIEEEGDMQEFTRVVLCHIGKEFVEYAEENMNLIKRKLADHYYYILHPGHIPFFHPKKKPEDISDSSKYPRNCLFDPAKWRFKDDFDISVEGSNFDQKCEKSLKFINSKQRMYNTKAAAKMHFQIEGGVIGTYFYFPYKVSHKSLSLSLSLSQLLHMCLFSVVIYFLISIKYFIDPVNLQDGKETHPDHVTGCRVACYVKSHTVSHS